MTSGWCPNSSSPIWICSLSWVMIFLSWFIFTPTICYYGYRFYENKSHPGIRTRHPKVTAVMVSVCLWFTFIANPIRYMEGTIHLFREDPEVFGWVTWLFSISILTFTYTGIWRIWLLYFDICWMDATGHNDWAKILNPDDKVSFFLKYKTRFGNEKYLAKWLLILFIIFFSIYTITMKIDQYGYAWNAIILICNIPPFVGLFILFFKTPELSDAFFIRYETKTWIALAVYILIVSLICAVLFAVYSTTAINVYVQFFFTTSFYVITIGIPVVSLYLVLHWVVYSQTNTDNYQQIDIFAPPRLSIGSKHSKSNHSISQIPSASPRYTRNQSLLALLSDSQGINAFMLHLKREFAIENLLGLIEMFQFLKVSQDKLGIQHEKLTLCRLTLADNVPISSINASNEKWRRKLELLYNKYVMDDAAEYQLNLPYALRVDFASLVTKQIHMSFNDKTDIEIIQTYVTPIIIKVIDETIKLLNDSLQRFRSSPEYQKFEMLYNDKSVESQTHELDDNHIDINNIPVYPKRTSNRSSRGLKNIMALHKNNSIKTTDTLNTSDLPTIVIADTPNASLGGGRSFTVDLKLPNDPSVDPSVDADIDNNDNESHDKSSQDVDDPNIPMTDDEDDDLVLVEDLDDPDLKI